MAKKKSAQPPRPQYRYGIGEWYGISFINMSMEERIAFAENQFPQEGTKPRCPFLSYGDIDVPCWKPGGGICTLRSYQKVDDQVDVDERGSTLRITCPSRFEENRLIYEWIGEVILSNPQAVPVGQVNFLERVPLMGAGEDAVLPEGEGVGRIDNVLIVPGTSPLQWCPIEIQAVYFSGDAMADDYRGILEHDSDSLPFPAGTRRLDYRSSGPKRLMPQLQIKVPTLRRWGKKMAVVVDEDFIKNMGRMETVQDISNCDVAWFVVRLDESSGTPRLTRGTVYFTQLEAAVLGLISGRAVTQARFEERILGKLERLGASPTEIPADE